MKEQGNDTHTHIHTHVHTAYTDHELNDSTLCAHGCHQLTDESILPINQQSPLDLLPLLLVLFLYIASCLFNKIQAHIFLYIWNSSLDTIIK